ncbi:hypothetical protein A4A49_39614 [Nicotiana attenuata]|uniref:Uncharacterized protein n=1 Tax=Nicotiana attenuata TaxID=49451 RepID=A0A1J6JSH7_NICAT|nr:hypothetical protein A4A49_39614 [Nicotiana attenuata]
MISLPFSQKKSAIYILKQIRDLVNMDNTITCVHDPKCKGLCSKCGANNNVLDVRVICKGRSNFVSLLEDREANAADRDVSHLCTADFW